MNNNKLNHRVSQEDLVDLIHLVKTSGVHLQEENNNHNKTTNNKIMKTYLKNLKVSFQWVIGGRLEENREANKVQQQEEREAKISLYKSK